MKKRIKVFILIFAVVLVGHQSYWFFSSGGNFTIWVNNSSMEKSILNVKIYLDDKEIIDDSYSNDILDYKSYTHKIYPGKHVLRVISMNNGIDEEYVFYSLFIRRASISFSDYIEGDEDKDLNTEIYIENVLRRKVLE